MDETELETFYILWLLDTESGIVRRKDGEKFNNQDFLILQSEFDHYLRDYGKWEQFIELISLLARDIGIYKASTIPDAAEKPILVWNWGDDLSSVKVKLSSDNNLGALVRVVNIIKWRKLQSCKEILRELVQ